MKKANQWIKSSKVMFLLTALLISAGCNNGATAPEDKITYGTLINSQPLPNVTASITTIAKNFVTKGFNEGFGGTDAGAVANMQHVASLYNFAPANIPPANNNVQNMEDYITSYAAKNKVSAITAYDITYNTPGVDPINTPSDINRIVSGLVIAPTMQAGEYPKGIVLLYHFTETGKNSVPSCIALAENQDGGLPDYCHAGGAILDDGTSNLYYNMPAALYAARGYIVVQPDYVGQGLDNSIVHPYVAFPENNALAGLNMVYAAQELLIKNGIINGTAPLSLFINGFSEGGGYALKASQLAQTTQADILKQHRISLAVTAPMEGAYSLWKELEFGFTDLKDGVFNGSFAKTNVIVDGKIAPEVAAENSWNVVSAPVATLFKSPLTGYVFAAVIYYDFRNLDSAYSTVLNDAYWQDISVIEPQVHGKIPALQCLTGEDPKSCVKVDTLNLYQLCTAIGLSTNEINFALVNAAFGFSDYSIATNIDINLYAAGDTDSPINNITIPETDVKSRLFGNNNSISAFANYSITKQPLFKQILDNGSTFAWTSYSPIHFINLAYDSVVAVVNHTDALTYMQQSSPGMITDTVIPNFQMTNVLDQYSPASATAIAQFWAPLNPVAKQLLPGLNAKATAQPTDHGNDLSYYLSNIVSACVFENWLASKGNTNTATCPAL
jgi:hypothetical protein